MLMGGGIEHMCYVPRICRSKGQWVFTDREGGLPDQLLKLLPTENIKIVPYAYTSRLRSCIWTTQFMLVEAFTDLR